MGTKSQKRPGLQQSLVRRLKRLEARMAALEERHKLEPRREEMTPLLACRAQTSEEPLSEELVLVIAAAAAAFLGKRAHVRQVTLIGSAPWAQQGRISIQASHALGVRGGGRGS